MFIVSVAHAAEEDLFAILDYVGADSPAMARHIQSHLSNAIDSLERYPHRGAMAVESESWGYTVRMLVVFNYRILYTVRSEHVVVLRIVHGSQLGPVPAAR